MFTIRKFGTCSCLKICQFEQPGLRNCDFHLFGPETWKKLFASSGTTLTDCELGLNNVFRTVPEKLAHLFQRDPRRRRTIPKGCSPYLMSDDSIAWPRKGLISSNSNVPTRSNYPRPRGGVSPETRGAVVDRLIRTVSVTRALPFGFRKSG